MFLFKSRKPSLYSVLFVCTANITRSATAEAMFRKLLEKSPHEWKTGSAGVKARKGIPAITEVKNVMYSRGMPMFQHRSQPFTRKLSKLYHWIIVMEIAHKEAILKVQPELSERVFTLREFGLDETPPEPDMPDPTGKEFDNFKELFEIMDHEMPRFFQILNYKIEDLILDEQAD